MTRNAPIPAAYLTLAAQLDRDPSLERDLPTSAAQLPVLDRHLLQALSDRSEAASLDQPRYSWALMAVAEAAASFTSDRFLCALAAWHVARAANDWLQPDRVAAAVQRARAGFAALNEPGWLAACDWQLYAVPWTRNFEDAVATLTRALADLIDARINAYAPHCRLSLAYAEALTGDYASAAEHIAASERDFAAQNDHLNMARCLITQARNLRQQAQFEPAIEALDQAFARLEALHAPIDLAKAHFQMAYCRRYFNADLPAAEKHFQVAARVFDEADVSLWLGQCHVGLAELYSEIGRLSEADRVLQLAAGIYAPHSTVGPYADFLVNHGKFQLLLGRERLARQDFERAKHVYAQLGSPLMSAVAAMYLGETLNQCGEYQRALQQLEAAYACFERLKAAYRSAECAMQLAQVWSQIGHYATAHAYLDKAADYGTLTRQANFLSTVYNFRAKTLFREHRGAEAIAVLQQALALAQEQGSHTQIALARRLLGEALAALDRYAEAIAPLQTALDSFTDMDMSLERAICLVALGKCYFNATDLVAAQAVYQQALDLSQGLLPDSEWQAWAGLARLAESAADDLAALHYYQHMVEALSRLQRAFSQPTLAGAYRQRPALTLDGAVALAVRRGAVRAAVRFIEANKAQIFTQQLGTPYRADAAAPSPELIQLTVDIRWLTGRLRAAFATAARLSRAEQHDLVLQLRGKHQQYAQLRERLGRSLTSKPESTGPLDQFDLDRFRQLAAERLGSDWIALDYYVTDAEIDAVLVTNRDYAVWRQPITGALRFALDTCGNAQHRRRYPTPPDLITLGRSVLPPTLWSRLTPDTHLIIAPHRQLHHIPWAALRAEPTGSCLVQTCVLSGAPSLHSLQALWQRPISAIEDRRQGLLLGISEFGGRRPDLPQVSAEIAALSRLSNDQAQCLTDAAATWPQLQALTHTGGWRRLAFWHIASHAFYDSVTGQLSGIALADQDVWLDQLAELAPLPDLITLSACSGHQSLMFEGDEAIGLTTTCLAAGARHVIGSLWPVRDDAAADLMADFYRYFFAGKGAARALAEAQRAAAQRHADYLSWATFRCSGTP